MKKKYNRRKKSHTKQHKSPHPHFNDKQSNMCKCSNCTCEHKNKCCFKDTNLKISRVIYGIASLFWMFLLYYLNISKYIDIDYIAFILLALPIIIFIFNGYFIED